MSVKKSSLKFDWERAIGTSCYVASIKNVARALASFAKSDGSGARPGIERLMRECSLKRSAVLAALRALTDDGWIIKAARLGVKRNFFDAYQFLMPDWLAGPVSERPDERRERERKAVADRMREERRAKVDANQVRMYGPNQIQTCGPDPVINWPDHTEGLGPYTGPDQVHTYGRLGPYTAEEPAGQIMPITTNRTTLKNNHGAPSVAGAPRAPLAAGPLVPHGVELADARSAPRISDPAESTGPVAAPFKFDPDEAFRNESNAYVAAAKTLDWDTVKSALAAWKAERDGEYEWARKRAIQRMGRGGSLKSARGYERADRLTIDYALRMHLDDGNWSEELLEPFAAVEVPLMPLAINDLDNVRRRSALKAYFEATRRMDNDTALSFGRRFRAEHSNLFDAAVKVTLAEMKVRPGRGKDPIERNRIAIMQMFNTTTNWPTWMTDAVLPQESAWDAA